MVGTSGWMDDNMKDFGKTTRCMEKELLFGLMVGSIKVII